MKKWLCIICGFIYDEKLGLSSEGIPAGTPWEAIPDDWKCPECGVGKSDFEMIELDDQTEVAPVVAIGMSKAEPIVIVGAGHAGFAAAEAIRQRDPNCSLILLTKDGGDRYSKPKLSVAVSSALSSEGLTLEPADQVRQRLSLDIRSHCQVIRIDPAGRRMETDSGLLEYGALVLATGAEPIRLPWYDESILCINHLDDLARLTHRLQRRRSIAIIGSGLIGCELANDLSKAGHDVTVLSNADYPLDRLVPKPVGRTLQQGLHQIGVSWRMQVNVVSGQRAGDGWSIGLDDGTTVEADVVISAIGLRPAVSLAREAGLALGAGIKVDSHCRTSDHNIFALGDVAEYPDGIKQFIAPINHGSQMLALAVLGAAPEDFKVSQPLMPVVVKTPACPVAVLTPPPGTGSWHSDSSDNGTVARWLDANGVLTGFALAGDAVSNLREWLAKVSLDSRGEKNAAYQ